MDIDILKESYIQVFNNPNGQMVLEDLRKRLKLELKQVENDPNKALVFIGKIQFLESLEDRIRNAIGEE